LVRRHRSYKILGIVIILLVMVLIGLPALLVRGCNWSRLTVNHPGGQSVRVQLASHQTVSMSLDDYLIGVVAAEMPADFDIEALKAQAVAARTYTLLRISSSPDAQHPNAPLCTDPGHCQAWISVAAMRKEWGFLSFGANYQKIATAVRTTSGEVLAYQGNLIDPVYHSSCGGRGTENAAAVWGHAVPYLQAVVCHWDPPQKQQTVAASLPLKNVMADLRITDLTAPASRGANLIQIAEKTPSGRVKTVQIGTHMIDGPDFRKELGLRSTDFTVRMGDNEVTFLTRGYGHAVGMCQYGAQGLALQGHTYRQILTYYYRGVQIDKK
jgi:stage II sporulation protein D